MSTPRTAAEACRLKRVSDAVTRCHELRREAELASVHSTTENTTLTSRACSRSEELLKRGGDGDVDALQELAQKPLGLKLSVEEARAALVRVHADLALLQLEDDSDLDEEQPAAPEATAASPDSSAPIFPLSDPGSPERQPVQKKDSEDPVWNMDWRQLPASSAIRTPAAADHAVLQAQAGKLSETPSHSTSPGCTTTVESSCNVSGSEQTVAHAEEAASSARQLSRLPFPVAEALRWLAWQESWHAALARAASGEHPVLASDDASGAGAGLPTKDWLRVPIRARLVEKASAQWSEVVASSGSQAQPPLDQATAECLAAASRAMARHCAARRVLPRSLEAAREEWDAYTAALKMIKGGEAGSECVFDSELLEIIVQLLQHSAWYAAKLVAQNQDTDAEDESSHGDQLPDDEAEHFGDNCPCGEESAQTSLARVLRHSFECHWGGPQATPRWRGILLPANAKARQIVPIARADFNVVRITVAQTSSENDPLDSARELMEACASASLGVVLDLSAWSLRSRRGYEGIRNGVAQIAKAAASYACTCGVVLPRVQLHAAAPFVAALRTNGLDAGRCAAVILLDDTPSDRGHFAGGLRKALADGDQGILLQDGHVVLEVARRPKAVESLQALLDEASHAHENVCDFLPLGCIRFSLAVPANLKGHAVYCEHFREELAARHSASAGGGDLGGVTHGWFAVLDLECLVECLGSWTWPDPRADRTLWPLGEHRFTFIYLSADGDPDAYLRRPEYFYWEAEQGKMIAIDGLKVVIPVQPILDQPANGQKCNGWYRCEVGDDGSFAEDAPEAASLERSTRRFHVLLDREAEEVPVDPALQGIFGVGCPMVYLGGTSQGCCMALHAGLTYPRPLGGIVACQGHLLSCTGVPEDWTARGTCVHICHGLANSMKPWETLVSKTYDRLREAAGDSVTVNAEPGVAQNDKDAEERWVRGFLAHMWTLWQQRMMEVWMQYFRGSTELMG